MSEQSYTEDVPQELSITEEPDKKASTGKKKALGRGLDALLGIQEKSAHDFDKTSAAFRLVLTDSIRPNPGQPRATFDAEAIESLAHSIKAQGLLQPLIVRKTDSGYELIAGERRLRAAKIAGLQKVPCIISDKEESGRLAASLIENLQREDLNPIEAAEGIRAMREKLRITQQEAADALGMSRPAVANLLRLLDLPDAALNLVRIGALSAGAARALLALPPEKIANAAIYCAENGLSVRQVEDYTRKIAADSDTDSGRKRRKTIPQNSKAAEHLSHKLTKYFGTKVIIKEAKEGGSIVLRYYSNEDLERLLEAFGMSEDPI